MADPYSILGVTRSASDDEVKKAYRNMCRKYHPDKNPGNQAAEDMFKIVQESYDQIMSERKNAGTSSAGGSGGYNYGYGEGNSSGSSYGSPFGSYGNARRTGASLRFSGPEASRYQAAVNLINSGNYREAINILSGIKDRSSGWYYLGAVANAGLGNTYVAMELARTAVSMEPDNQDYRDLLSALQGGGFRYQNMGSMYGSNMYYDNNFCTKMCALNLCINACCNPCC